MNKKRLTVVVCIAFLVSSIIYVLAFAQQKRGGRVALGGQQANSVPQKQNVGIPEHIFYGQVFTLLLALKNTADYQSKAGLNDEQANLLEQIAKDCQHDVALQDAEANKIIDQFRNQMAKRKPGVVLQTPLELEDLQRERNAIILRYRDSLKTALGEEAFARFDDAARKMITVEVRNVQ